MENVDLAGKELSWTEIMASLMAVSSENTEDAGEDFTDNDKYEKRDW